jgi:sporulation protein YlmC with PRC-barrel domain
MSSELRTKKLRGSGGFVMASVTDAQQQKGNLGGPDLFLAPIGRLESEKISKYFCNTCEKDFEGSPKIEFESPNEQVAENLILVERGQYICNGCGSALAEYRDFQKPDENRDVGNAKPTSPDLDRMSPTQSSNEPPLVMPDFIQTSPPEPLISETQTRPMDSFSSILGMAVYDENANRIGTAKQVGVDSSHSVVLIITDNEGNDVTLPWNRIQKVGEIVLLGTPTGTITSPSGLIGACRRCGFVNKEGSKFCEDCGTNI